MTAPVVIASTTALAAVVTPVLLATMVKDPVRVVAATLAAEVATLMAAWLPGTRTLAMASAVAVA